MAEAAQSVPTFKLVLVGDGGTGKVRISLPEAHRLWIAIRKETLYDESDFTDHVDRLPSSSAI